MVSNTEPLEPWCTHLSYDHPAIANVHMPFAHVAQKFEGNSSSPPRFRDQLEESGHIHPVWIPGPSGAAVEEEGATPPKPLVMTASRSDGLPDVSETGSGQVNPASCSPNPAFRVVLRITMGGIARAFRMGTHG